MNNENSVSATIVADHLLWLRKDIETTVMHILKLTYLAHGWMLGFHKRPLIKEPIEALIYGPVIPILLTCPNCLGHFLSESIHRYIHCCIIHWP